MGFKIGLHTNGAFPSVLRRIVGLLDWVALDVKAPLSGEKYSALSGHNSSLGFVIQSLQILLESNIEYEIHTTYDPSILNNSEIEKLSLELHQLGVSSHKLQQMRSPSFL